MKATLRHHLLMYIPFPSHNQSFIVTTSSHSDKSVIQDGKEEYELLLEHCNYTQMKEILPPKSRGVPCPSFTLHIYQGALLAIVIIFVGLVVWSEQVIPGICCASYAHSHPLLVSLLLYHPYTPHFYIRSIFIYLLYITSHVCDLEFILQLFQLPCNSLNFTDYSEVV